MRRWICGKDPRQHVDFGLWTRRLVAELVEEKFKHRLSVTAVGRLLATFEITPQKPELRRAYERDPVAIAKWKEGPAPSGGARTFSSSMRPRRSDAALQRTWGAKRVRRRSWQLVVSASASTLFQRSMLVAPSGTMSIR